MRASMAVARWPKALSRDPVIDLEPDLVLLVSMVGRGWTDERIARAFGISRSTVQRRIRRVSALVSAFSRVTLVVRSIQVGAIECKELMVWGMTRTHHP